MDYRIAKTPSMHCRLGSGTVTAGFPQGRQPDFPWEKSHWDNTIVKMKKKTRKKDYHSSSNWWPEWKKKYLDEAESDSSCHFACSTIWRSCPWTQMPKWCRHLTRPDMSQHHWNSNMCCLEKWSSLWFSMSRNVSLHQPLKDRKNNKLTAHLLSIQGVK